MAPELTTVSEAMAVVFDGQDVRRYEGLPPDAQFEFDEVAGRTLPHPGGALLSRIATVNDVHFGETRCGVIEGSDIGPVISAEPGERPYPETMNYAAVAEIKKIDPAVVIAKGDLTAGGTQEEYDAFVACYGGAFGERLIHIRGNHDAYHRDIAPEGPVEHALPGATIALLDTVIPRKTTGQVPQEQLDWLDELAARTSQPVLVFGHHHNWSPTATRREAGYFGINPDDSDKLIDVFARRPNLVGYFAGHTHRNRVRLVPATGTVPWVEVGATKDYPGAWAEYRVFEGGILQVMHRICAPEAIDWTNRTRATYGGLYPQYSFGEMKDRCFVVC
ncbi:MAG TPA: metallophosphoesterase [Acidimicrobiales bacterium]|nr:metallophosphoesterase [Acidimicrobiales bacterium]